MAIYNKHEIMAALDEKVTAFCEYINSLDRTRFESTPAGKWSAGQNLDHLIRSIKPLQPAYRLPKFILRLLFGKANRPSRTYDELVNKYKTKLLAGGRASGRFVPLQVSIAGKSRLLKEYTAQKTKLIRKIGNQNEEDLDKYVLPHPLLGKLTLREMLFFTIYHNQHHLELLKNRSF